MGRRLAAVATGLRALARAIAIEADSATAASNTVISRIFVSMARSLFAKPDGRDTSARAKA